MPTYPKTFIPRLLKMVILISGVFLLASITLPKSESNAPVLIVLGIAQDAGFPQAACEKACCATAWQNHSERQMVSCLGIADPQSGQVWLLDATPDFKDQLRLLQHYSPGEKAAELAGVFLTHGHIGHYTGLMHLGREAMGAKGTSVFAMPRMQKYLSENGPWQQLIQLRNIALQPLAAGQKVQLNDRISVTPFLVPHRDEYTETVGYRIDGPEKSAIFIPDIDKCEKWDRQIEALIAEVDVAYLDGTFYANGEIPGRDMSQIPHPFIRESMARFAKLADSEKEKIVFIHLNHTNPALQKESEATSEIETAGFRVAQMLEAFQL